jgi:oligopeptide transport system substrate-binding protein
MVSSGPFVLHEWLPKDRIVLRKNQRYYEREAVCLDELVFLPTVREATRMNLYKTSQSHVTDVRVIPPVLAPVVVRAKDSHLSAGCRVLWYSINTTRPPLDNVLVRYALNMAIDRAALVKNLGAGRLVARGFVPPIRGYRGPNSLPVSIDGHQYDVLSFDPEAARSMLDRANYPGGAGRDGSRLRINLTFPESETKLLHEIVQQQWRSVLNVSATIRVEETSTFLGETCLRRSYDGVVRDAWTAVVNDPFDFLLTFGPAQFACSAWADKVYDAMLASAHSTLNTAERMRKLAEVESYLLRQMPLLPIYQDSWLSLRKPYVRGVPQNRLGWPMLKYAWIDPDWSTS